MKVKLCCLLLVIICWVSHVSADSGAKVGFVHTMKGNATIVRGGQSLPAAPGLEIYRDDVLQTAKESALGIVMEDDSTISLGAESEFAIKTCEFSPSEGRFSLVLRMLKGTFAYISGMISKLAPGAVQLEIPDGTIAVRGTKLLVDVRE